MGDGGLPQPLARCFAPAGAWTVFEHHPEVDSTNAVARRRARDSDARGLVVVADHQTAGRGRLGRGWEDRPGASLLTSVLVASPAERPTLVPLAAGLAVVAAAAAAGVGAALKWPNDVVVAGRKCAGILVETAPGDRLVVGVGVNVKAWGDDAPPGATSLEEAAGRDVDRWAVLAAFLTEFAGLLAAMRTQPDAVLDRYRACCETLGADVSVEVGGGVLSGTAEDVDADGALVVRTGAGAVAVRAGDVRHVRPLDLP